MGHPLTRLGFMAMHTTQHACRRALFEQTPKGGLGCAHLQSYLDEFSYRLNRRGQRLDLFRRIPDRCVLYTPPTTHSQLIAA